MSTPTFAETHNLIVFLEKPTESDGFEQIIDFLNANLIKYALTVSPTIYTLCVKQFLTFAKVKTVNEDVQLLALVDGKKVIIHETSIRRDLRLDDAEGTTCLPNAAIFEELARMGTMASAIICLANNQKFNFSKYILDNMEHIPTPSHDPLPSGKDRLQLNELMEICTKLSDMVLSLEQIKTNQAVEIEKLKKRVKKLKGKKKKRTHGMKRLYKVGLSARVESSKEEEVLGDQEDASKQGRIAEIDADKDLSLINETAQDLGRMNDEDLFGVNDLDGDEVIMDVTAGKYVEQDATVAKKEVSLDVDEVVTTAESVEGITAATTPQISKDDVTTSSSQPSQLPQAKDKGKGIMVEHEKPLKKKDQISFDEEVVRKLDAQMKAKMEKEERIAREKDEANKASIYFCGYEYKDSGGKFKKTQAEVTEGSSKRAADEIEQESAKRQRLEKEDDTAELKRCLKIVPEDDDDVTIKATPLSSKSPTKVDYKIYKERKISYFKIIRADGNSQNYLTFRTMFKNFNKEDLEVLRNIMKERFKKIKPVNDMDNLLFQTLKTMFEHHVEHNIWKYKQGVVKVHNWKLYDSCGVYCVTTQHMVYYLLVEKIYPFTKNILHQMWNDVRL
nr:hypothetical protein [Tanacetum cinerariifolium]